MRIFGGLLTTVKALSVDPEQDLDAVPGPFGYLRRGNARVEP